MTWIYEMDFDFENLGGKYAYVEVVPNNYNFHPKLQTTVAVFIKDSFILEGAIIPVDHPEGNNVSKEKVIEILSKYEAILVPNKKDFLYHFQIKNLWDANLLSLLENGERLAPPVEPKVFNHYYNKYSSRGDVNKLIPITKLYERCNSNSTYFGRSFELKETEDAKFYNQEAVPVFYLLEQAGLQIHYQKFIDLFKPSNIDYSTRDNVTYTSYNLYNVTSRPTNAFNSVNFSAIPKKDEYRKVFTPQNDYFVEFDFDGYHLRLLCDIIDYQLGPESAHLQMGRIYFNKEELTDEEYLEAKQLNFQAIYGNIPYRFEDLEIFRKTKNYINKLWKQFEKKGYVEAPISKRRFVKDQLEDMNPQKLMNYVIQNVETSRNVLILKELLRYLKDKETKISLYTYDSILLDFSKQDGKETLQDIERILNEDNKFPVRFKFSDTMVL